MAGRIPEIQRKKLASSAVGVVGADNSMAKAIYHTAGVMKDVNDEERKLQKAQAAQDVKIKDALGDSRTNLRVMGLNTEIDALRAKDPKEFNQKVQELLEQRGAEIEDDNERVKFYEDGSELLKSKSSTFSKNHREHSIAEVKGNVDSHVDGMSNDITDLFREEKGSTVMWGFKTPPMRLSFDQKMDKYQDMIQVGMRQLDKASGAFDADEFQKYKKETKKEWARSAIDGLLASDPSMVEPFLDKLDKDMGFTADEMTEFRTTATKMAEARKSLAKSVQIQEKDRTRQDWSKRVNEGEYISNKEMTTALLDGRADAGDIKAVKDQQESGAALFLQDNPMEEMALSEEFRGMTNKIFKKKEVVGAELKEDVTFEAVADFRQKIMEARTAKKITKETAASWLNVLEQKFDEGVEETFKNLNHVDITIGWAMDQTANVITEPKKQRRAKGRLATELLQAIDREEKSKRRRLTLPELRKVKEGVVDNFVHFANENRGKVTLGEVVVGTRGAHKGVRLKVVGIAGNGEPLLDTDLTKSVTLENDDLIDKYGAVLSTAPRPPIGEE